MYSFLAAGFGIGDLEEIRRQTLAESAMDFTERFDRASATSYSTIIDPFLYFDMCYCFELQIARLRLVAEVVSKSALNVDRVGVMSLDQVAVVAVHRANHLRQRASDSIGKAPLESFGRRRKLQRQII